MASPLIDKALAEKTFGPYADTVEPADTRAERYLGLMGFVPPRVQSRIAITGALDPVTLDLQEKLRAHAMYPACFDTKTAQLMLFGMLLMDLSDAALLHGGAARRAGASWEEMQAVISLCFLFRGLSAANRGAEILATLAQREQTGEGHAATVDAPNGGSDRAGGLEQDGARAHH